jgi:hypothetical protein
MCILLVFSRAGIHKVQMPEPWDMMQVVIVRLSHPARLTFEPDPSSLHALCIAECV